MGVDYRNPSLAAEGTATSGVVDELLVSATGAVQSLTDQGAEGTDDTALVSLVGRLEELKRAVCAAQVRLTHDLRELREAAAVQSDGQVSVVTAIRGAGAEIALARREPVTRANHLVDVAAALATDMPNTLAALNAGLISEWAATVVVKETALLSAEHRHEVDVSLVTHFGTCRDGRLGGLARSYGMTLDPDSQARQVAKAMADRKVTCRPAPDAMAYLTALLPAADAADAQAELIRLADSARAAGDPRTRGQVMADHLVQRITGRRPSQLRDVKPDAASDADSTAVDSETEAEAETETATETEARVAEKPAAVMLNLVLSGEALFTADGVRGEPGGYDNTAWLNGEPIPAWLARDLVTDPDTKVRLRRIFAHPTSGQLVAIDSRALLFDDGLRRLVMLRDQRCRLCDAPIRHVDHVRARHAGGTTSADNGQGLCEFCNYLKEFPGWSQETIVDPDNPNAPPVVATRTPTGHTYHSRAPAQLPAVRTSS